jgi:hypothetical protein
MHSFLFKFAFIINSVLLFQKLLVFEFLLGISETLFGSVCTPHVKNCPSAGCASAANVFTDVDVFGAKNVLLNNIL